MDSHANSEFFSLAEEKFDFDVSLSPASSRGDEDDDEVFVGPVCHKERCISVGLETIVKENVSSWPSVGEGLSWSPLAVDKFEEICKEAHLLASQLVVNEQHPNVGETNGTLTMSKEEPKEDFVQDAGAKLCMFRKPVDAVLSPIKRETFCVQDSPLKQLPPAVQQRLLRAGGVSNSTKSSVGSSSPVRVGTTTQPKMVRRGRVGLACNTGVLPSKQKPAARGATTAQQIAKTRPAPAERTTMLPPPSKGNLGLRRSPCSRNSSRAGSCEDLLSDTASVASDISDTSLNSSLQGKRNLVPPSKSGMRAPSVAKAPPPQTRRVTDQRRNTSSSSSSVSSFNSSLSVSPTGKGKLNTSLNSSISGSNGRLPTGKSRLTNPGVSATNTRRSTLIGRAPEPPSSTTGARRAISAQGRKPSEPDRSKTVQSTPLKRAEPAAIATLLHQTPAKTNMGRMSSVPNIPTSSSATTKSVVRGNPKLKAFIAPTPTSQFKRRLEAVSSPDAPRIMKPKRLMSACSVESLPYKLALPVPELLQTPPAGGNKEEQPKTRRPSALPTPVNRRISGIPMLTPKSISRPGRPSLSMANLPASTRRASYWSPAQLKGSHQEEVVAAPEEETVQPFSLEDEPEVQPSTPATVPHPEEQEVSQDVPEPGVDQEPSATNKENNHPEPSEESKEFQNTEKLLEQPQCNWMKTQEVNEVLLVDAPAPVLRPYEKLLIDLSNTPVLIRTASVKTSGGQLIDLSSPLIKWSPEDKDNALNDAPLINLSF